MTPTTKCIDGAITSDGALYCIGSNLDVYQWTGTTWTCIRALADADTLAAASGNKLVIVNSSNNMYAWTGGTTWGQVTGLGFTPKNWISSVSIGDDGSMSIMDTSYNVHISHDRGGHLD